MALPAIIVVSKSRMGKLSGLKGLKAASTALLSLYNDGV